MGESLFVVISHNMVLCNVCYNNKSHFLHALLAHFDGAMILLSCSDALITRNLKKPVQPPKRRDSVKSNGGPNSQILEFL